MNLFPFHESMLCCKHHPEGANILQCIIILEKHGTTIVISTLNPLHNTPIAFRKKFNHPQFPLTVSTIFSKMVGEEINNTV